jgi:integrase
MIAQSPEAPSRRPRRRTLSDKQIAALPRKRRRYSLTDPELGGHVLRVPPDGPIIFYAVARSPFGKPVWSRNGTADLLTIAESREITRTKIKRVQAGSPAVEPPPVKPESFESVAEAWLKRHVQKRGLRTGADVERVVRKHILPHWGDRDFTSLRKSDLAALLDHVEDNSGPHMADIVGAHVRNISRWYGERSDDYASPFAHIKKRVDSKAAKRTHVLTDDEIRRVWAAAEGTFGAFIKLALLTGQRRDAVIEMRWSQIKDGVWHMPTPPRAKGVGGSLKLPPLAMQIVDSQPRFLSNPFVFAGRNNGGPFTNLSYAKAKLDEASGVVNWRIHDMRRSARSLMSRAGVPGEVAERVLGHAVGSTVEQIYNRHSFDDEKGLALAKLAALIEQIVDPKDNVVALQRSAVS